MNYSNKHKIEIPTISFLPNGILILEEPNLKKIILGNDQEILKTQLKTISNLKNKLIDKNILRKIDTIDLTDPKNPKIKVFKP